MVVSEQVKIDSERIDDIPVIVEWLKQMEIAKCVDQKLSPPHGNHEGLSYGQLSVLLLTYIITQSDHRLCAVEAWVEAHRQILERCTGWLIRKKDATDDRLGKVVEKLGKQPEARQEIEIKLGRHIRDFQLNKYPKFSCGVGILACPRLKRASLRVPQYGEFNFWKSLRKRV